MEATNKFIDRGTYWSLSTVEDKLTTTTMTGVLLIVATIAALILPIPAYRIPTMHFAAPRWGAILVFSICVFPWGHGQPMGCSQCSSSLSAWN